MYFYLKSASSDKDTLISLHYKIPRHFNLPENKRKFVYSTGLNVNPKDWSFEQKAVKAIKGRPDLNTIKRKLNEYSQHLEKTLSYVDLQKIQLTKEYLKNSFDTVFNPRRAKVKFIYFTDFVDDFIENAPNLINRSTGKNYSPDQLRNYRNVRSRVKEFEIYRNEKILIESFTIKIYDEFIIYCTGVKNCAINYTGNLIKYVKKFLAVASETYEIHQDIKLFTKPQEQSSAIYLNEGEIKQIFDHDFSKNKSLENCRDIFIIGLWTGLRVGDFMNLPEIDIEKDFIEVRPSKTIDTSNVKVMIPLHYQVKEVIKARGMPQMLSDVTFNRYIKLICKEVGFVQLVKGSVMSKVEITEKGKTKIVNRKVSGMYEKYKLVSSHTCRRSFATNLYKSNFPSISIMQITGHKTEKNFLKYIKVTPKEHAQKLLDHWNSYYEKG